MSIYVELEEKTLMETLDKLIQACFTSLDIFCLIHALELRLCFASLSLIFCASDHLHNP